MSQNIKTLRNNASILYHYLCSDDADKVYVDHKGHLQIDERLLIFRLLLPLNSTQTQIYQVVIKTLQNVLKALENRTLESDKIILQKYKIGQAINKKKSYPGIKHHLSQCDSCFKPKNPSQLNTKWVTKEAFSNEIRDFFSFKIWMPTGYRHENELSFEQKFYLEIDKLTQMIIHGKENYIKFYSNI